MVTRRWSKPPAPKKRLSRCMGCGQVVPSGDNYCSDDCYRAKIGIPRPQPPKTLEHPCRICGKPVMDSRWCCSRECNEEYNRRLFTRHCFWCGTEFLSRRKARFCSGACKVAAHRAGKAQEDDPIKDGFDGRGVLTRRFLILERDNFTCRYCGRSVSQGVVLHVDHVQPKSQGGSDSADNLVTACYECNEGKNDILLKRRPP